MITIMSEAMDACVRAFCLLPGREKLIQRREALFRRGQNIEQLFIVLCGEIVLTRTSREGDELVLQRAVEQQIVAQASLASATYHCDALASQDTRLYSVPASTVLHHISQDASFALDWIFALSADLHAARAQTGILRMKNVRGRLDAWLALHGGKLPDKGQRIAVAREIGVTPEALYRELARRD